MHGSSESRVPNNDSEIAARGFPFFSSNNNDNKIMIIRNEITINK